MKFLTIDISLIWRINKTANLKYLFDLVFDSWATNYDNSKLIEDLDKIMSKFGDYYKFEKYDAQKLMSLFAKIFGNDVEKEYNCQKYKKNNIRNVYIPIQMYAFVCKWFYPRLLYKFYTSTKRFDPINGYMSFKIDRKIIDKIYNFADSELRCYMFLEHINNWMEFNGLSKIYITKSNNKHMTLYVSYMSVIKHS